MDEVTWHCEGCGKRIDSKITNFCDECTRRRYWEVWHRPVSACSEVISAMRTTTVCIIMLFISSITLQAETITGKASYYGKEACRYNMDAKCPTASGDSLFVLEQEGVLFAASWQFPLRSTVKVCNTTNNKCVVTRILDRGPNRRFKDRVIDLSEAAFNRIGDRSQGLIQVEVTRVA